MSARSTQIKLVGAAGAAALVVATLGSPALAADKTFAYTCTTLGPVGVNYDAGTLPTSMVAGQKVTQAATLTVNLVAEQVQGVEDNYLATNVGGSAANTNAGDPLSFAFALPTTDLPDPAADIAIVSSTGTETLRPVTAGEWTVAPGDLSAPLTLSTPGGDVQATVTCLAPTDGSNALGTIKVTKDTTTTKLSHTYNAKRHIVGGTATVKSHYGLRATGKVTFVLKKGTKRIGKVVASVKNGKAKASFKKVTKAGKYTLTASYGGNGGLKGSKAKANVFRIR